MPLIDITAPLIEPVAITDASLRTACRVDGTEFDAQLSLIVSALRGVVENRINRRLITQTVELVIDAFPCNEIDLTLPNVQSITSVKYIDTSGVQQTLTTHELDSDNEPCLLRPAYGENWPETRNTPNAVRVRFIVGYGPSANDVPAEIRAWIIAHAAQAVSNPAGLADGNVNPLPFVDCLLDKFRTWRAA